jgi:hypothetical protein
MLAAAGGHIDAVQRLLRVRHKNYRVSQHLEHLSDFGQTALALAAQNGHADIVQLLVGEGASLNVPGTIILWPMLFSGAIENRIDPSLIYEIISMCPIMNPKILDQSGSSSSVALTRVAAALSPLFGQRHHNEMPNLTLSALVLMNQRILRASLGFSLYVPFPGLTGTNEVPPELYLIHFLRCVCRQNLFISPSTSFPHSARSKHPEDACAQRFELVTGVTLSKRQKCALLCMGGHGAFFFNTIVANHQKTWQKKARSK